MKKRAIIILLSIILVVCLLSIALILTRNKDKRPDKGKPQGMSDNEIMDLYLDMLLEHKKFADTLFTDTSDIVPDTGYFGNGGGQRMRTSNNYALYYAFLYTQLPGSKYMPESTDAPGEDAIADREQFLAEVKAKAIAGIRYGVYTHNAVKKMTTIASMATDSGKWWGPNDWQSSLYANGLLLASSFMWDHLDEELKKDIEKVAAAEGDRAVRSSPRTYAPGNTGAEENAWDTNGPALAYCMFPDHKSAAKWNEAAIKFAMNSFSRELDKNDNTVVDGKSASQWITTSNLFNDYSLENHNILHPTYSMSPVISFADSVVAYAYHGKKIPEAFTYNLLKVSDNVLKKLVYPTGEWAYPNGCDWTLNLPGKVEAFALISILLQDEEAKLLEINAAKLAVERQKIAGDGRFVHLADIGTEREAVNVKRIMYAYLLHKYVGNQPERSVTWDEFVENNKGTVTYLDGNVIVNNSRDRFASLSWKNKFMGLVTPNSDGYADSKYVTHPNLPNIIGSVSIRGAGTDKSYITHKTYFIGEQYANGLYAGFSSIGCLSESNGAVMRYISMTVLPTNAVIIMDKTVAQKDVSISSGYVVPISFQTDVVSGEQKYIVTQDGKDSFKAGADVSKEYNSSYVNVDEHTGIILDKSMRILFGDYKVSSQNGGSTLKFMIEPGMYTAGQSINDTTAIIYSNVATDNLLKFKRSTEYLDLPNGWQGVIVKDVDDTSYYIINSFYGSKGSFTYEGDDYVPVFLDEMTVQGKKATVTLPDGMASYTGAMVKFIKTDGSLVNVSNSKSDNAFYIENPNDKAVDVSVMLIYKGKQETANIKIGAKVIFRVETDGKVKSRKIDSLPKSPDKVSNVKAEYTDKGMRLSWDTAANADSYIISREESNGGSKQQTTVKSNVNEYLDKDIKEGVSYRYCIVAVEAMEGFESEPSYSSLVSTGEYKDSTGKVNLAYKKPASYAHGVQGSYPESYALDDDLTTFAVNNDFLPNASDPEYFDVDLLGKYRINEIILLPRTTNAGYGPKEVEFFYTVDGENYISLGKKTIANSHDVNVNSIKFAAVEATKIRVKITSSYSVKNVQIVELKVYKAD